MKHITLPRLLGKLPRKYQWTVHNLLAHPLSEFLHLVGLTTASNICHDITVPSDPKF